ncbi:MAG TPA: hypothetical protein VGB79_08280 [Allosphingosinicella sp.]|jgi:hypothetical protein
MIRVLAAAFALPLAACAPATGMDAGEVSPQPAQGEASVGIGGEARLGGLSLRVLRLVEDSRCPASVQCIQAGTVRIAVRLSQNGAAREAVLRLRGTEPLSGGRLLHFYGACPSRGAPGPAPAEARYRFLLAVAPAGADIPNPPMCAP